MPPACAGPPNGCQSDNLFRGIEADYVLEFRNAKLAALAALKKSLLHQAFSGNL
jgi:hypothetical protein